jgi:hypothetical protein
LYNLPSRELIADAVLARSAAFGAVRDPALVRRKGDGFIFLGRVRAPRCRSLTADVMLELLNDELLIFDDCLDQIANRNNPL